MSLLNYYVQRESRQRFYCSLRLAPCAYRCLCLSPCLFRCLRLSPCVFCCLRRCLVCFVFRPCVLHYVFSSCACRYFRLSPCVFRCFRRSPFLSPFVSLASVSRRFFVFRLVSFLVFIVLPLSPFVSLPSVSLRFPLCPVFTGKNDVTSKGFRSNISFLLLLLLVVVSSSSWSSSWWWCSSSFRAQMSRHNFEILPEE